MPIYHGTAHPRVSGENIGEKAPPALATGSSPRERGKLWVFASGSEPVRLIPA